MPRKAIKLRKKPRPVLHDSLRYYLETGIYCTRDKFPDCPAKAETFLLAASSREKQLTVWQLNREVILTDWIKQSPCSRPFFWWDFEVPEIRQRISGVGDLWHDIEDYEPHECYFGIPSAWVSDFDEAYYNGKALDIHGKIIPSPFKDGDFKKIAVDLSNPPTFESQTSFLQRHDFLTEAEKRYLAKHSELLEPEAVEFNEDKED